jgi:hypothetical protein
MLQSRSQSSTEIRSENNKKKAPGNCRAPFMFYYLDISY